MKLLLAGANGAVGNAAKKALQNENNINEIITLGRSSGDFQVDMTNKESIRKTFESIGKFDALVVTAGEVAFNSFNELTEEEWQSSFNSKLMGQVNLTRLALEYLNDKGSVTLTTGILSEVTIAGGVVAASVNAAVNHFVQAVSTEMPRGIRINAVSPTILASSWEALGSFFPGFEAVSDEKVGNAFVRSVLGVETGQVIKALA